MQALEEGLANQRQSKVEVIKALEAHTQAITQKLSNIGTKLAKGIQEIMLQEYESPNTKLAAMAEARRDFLFSKTDNW